MATNLVELNAGGGQGTNGQPPQPRKPTCVPGSGYDESTKVLQAISASRNRPLFALISDFIDKDVSKDVHSWKKELRGIGSAGPLDVLIQSPGGQLTPRVPMDNNFYNVAYSSAINTTYCVVVAYHTRVHLP